MVHANLPRLWLPRLALDVGDRPRPPATAPEDLGTSQQRYVKFRGAGEASGVLLYHCTVSQSLVCETRGNDRFYRRFSVS